MAALSLLLLTLLPDATPRLVRFGRTLAIGAVAFAIAAFQLVPLLRDTAFLNHSRWEPVWKWDSFGAGPALARLFTGELLDHGRLPVLTLLTFAGAALLYRRRRPAHAFLAAGALFWILLYFGRAFWGPLLTVLGAAEDMHLHRVIGGAQIFLVLLGALALAEAWAWMSARWHYAAAIAFSALLFYPMVRERAANLANDAAWGHRNLAAYAAERPSLDAAIASAQSRGGRTYAGLAATWGGQFKIGDVPFYAFLSEAQVPAVAFLYHSMALTGDIMVRFNDRAAAQYRLFNIRSVIAPMTGLNMPPGLLLPRAQFGRFQVFDAPGGGYFDLVDAGAVVKATRQNFYEINDRWLESDWPGRRTHLLLDFAGEPATDLPRMLSEAPLPFLASPAPSPGDVAAEQQSGQTYSADLVVTRASYAQFKMTWHPAWKAYLDNVAQPVVMLSPGFSGVKVAPGRHRVEFRYEPGALKPALAIFGVLFAAFLGLRGSRVAPAPLRLAVPRQAIAAAGILALALPVCVNLFSGSVLWGHDAFCYFPRVVEAHQNLIHGILLPRWAPDL
ncbi:MAG TPA: hypothetical protein VGC80_14510, partial [Acetobacteraceae bacterium]